MTLLPASQSRHRIGWPHGRLLLHPLVTVEAGVLKESAKDFAASLCARDRCERFSICEAIVGTCSAVPQVRLLTCRRGCPATTCKNLSSPSRRDSMTSSVNRLVNTLPGSGGMFTLVDSRSRISRKYSKSEYRRRTDEYRTRNAGMLVCKMGKL
jgi:hypothetical protein